MGRLIDVDKFKADYGMKDDCADCDKELRGKSKSCEFDRVYTKMDFCGWLDDAPAVDAVPVRHGYWIRHNWAEEVEGCLIPNYECSVCHTWKRDESDYCPDCGARMDGKDGNDG